MPEGNNGKREDPKVAFDTARAIATISIAVAAFFISVAGVTFLRFSSDGAVNVSTQKGATVAMVTVALFSLICAANCIDWIMDHIEDEQWKKVLSEEELRRDLNKFDQFLFRLTIYNFAYSFFSLFVSSLSGASLWFVMYILDDRDLIFLSWPTFGSIVLALYVFYQMMTKNSRYGRGFLAGVILMTFVFYWSNI
jgi:hypothetical protein